MYGTWVFKSLFPNRRLWIEPVGYVFNDFEWNLNFSWHLVEFDECEEYIMSIVIVACRFFG